jgi:predicted O-methyltransferase YrrM
LGEIENEQDWKLTNQSAEFIGDIPHHYDKYLGPVIIHDYASPLGQLVADMEPNCVLELASGTGISTRCIRDTLPSDCILTASDLNAPILEVTRQKISSEDNIEIEIIDAGSIPVTRRPTVSFCVNSASCFCPTSLPLTAKCCAS